MAALAENSRGSVKPPLKWAGGKRWLIPHLREVWAAHRSRRLVEPFCGGLAVAMGLQPPRALLNDVNPHAINFYRQLQNGFQIEMPMWNDERSYYDNRERFNQLITSGATKSDEAASLFYYLNRTGYNGLCRFNSAGWFNVPFGQYKSITYTVDFSSYKSALSAWEFAEGDFARLAIRPEDFIYADPPYDAGFTRYAKEDFTWADQERLAGWLARHPGPVVASNQATPRIEALYRGLGFRLTFLDAPRMISCTGDRTRAREVLALKDV